MITAAERDEMLSGIDTAVESIGIGIDMVRSFAAANMDLMASFGNFESNYMGLVQPDGALELYDGKFRLIDPKGNIIVDQYDPADYLSIIGEHVEPWSYLKFPFYKPLGYPEGTYRVGPLGRLNVASKIATPKANAEFERYRGMNNGEPFSGSLFYHYARLIEALYAAERAQEILEDPALLSDDLMTESSQINRTGVGCIEAPRGTLIHQYWVDETGKLEKVNLIVATGHNNAGMNKAVKAVAQEYVDSTKLTEGMLNRVEHAIRCYDPCLSCSTHALGRMPLHIDLVGPDGTVVDQVER